jgi:hypothetical protein
MPLISVPSQLLSGRQDEIALDPLVEVESKVPNVPGQEMYGMSFDGSQWDRYILLRQGNPTRKSALPASKGWTFPASLTSRVL